MMKIIQKYYQGAVAPDPENRNMIKVILGHFMLLAILLCGFSALAQDPPQYGTPFNGVPDLRDINMYQVHIRPFSANGDLDGVTAQLDRIQSLGINVIYLMPIFPHGTDSQSSPSPYCIKDFKSVASEYGNLTDLRELVDGAHSRGMAVILDIAINGTSWDHSWTVSNPEYYLRSGGQIQQLANFSDIAALDLNHSGTRAAIKDAMRYWIFAANIDGYRCDFANNPPLDFWSEVIGDLRGITSHDLLMLAEGDRQENFTAGFDLNWGDRWFWNGLKNVAEGGPVSTRFQTMNDYEYALASGNQQAVRYTGNHDTYTNDNGSHRPFVVFNNHDGIVANFAVSAFMKGVPFLMSGQEIDYEPMTPWPWNGFKFNWSQNPGAAADFAEILNFRKNSTAIRRGALTMYPNDNVSVFTKTSGSEQVLVIANLRNYSTSYNVPSALAGNWKDAFTGANVNLPSGNLSLSAYEYLTLTNEDVDPVAVTGVNVSPGSASISAGLTQQLSASVVPSNATNQNVSWFSSNTSVATVNASGLVTAVAAGTATITATTQDGNHTDNAQVMVNPSSNFTVHFYKPTSWGTNIQIYWWAAQPSGVLADGSWPGVSMTNEGNGWYSHTFTNVTSTNLIFNDGSSQTADLSRSSDGWYQNGTWYSSNPGGCSPTAITPHLTVNGGSWSQTASATLDAGGSVTFGPQPASGGSWSWSGPGGFTASTREVALTNVQTGQSGDYTASYTNTCGTISNQIFSLTVNPGSVSQSPYGGSAASIPGTIQFENFDNGGEGTAYHDGDASNNGGQYRTAEGVDIEVCSEGGYNVGWTGSGEWLEYTVDVASTDNYDIEIRVAGTGGTFRIEFGGVDKTGTITTPNTGGWQSWQTVAVNDIALSAGQQVMRVYMTSGGFNLNSLAFTASSTGGGGNAYRIRNRWQNTYLYDNGAQAAYGTPSAANQNSHWELETIDGHTAIKNVGTGDYLNIEGLEAYVECTAVSTSYWSAQWAIEDYDGHKRIRNRWQSGDYIHVEDLTGNAQYGSVSAGAWSSHWALESVSGARLADVATLNEVKVELYPNPVVSQLQLKAYDLEQPYIDISITDVSGRNMMNKTCKVDANGSLDEEINTDFLKAGIYFLRFRSNGKMNVFKVVKE